MKSLEEMTEPELKATMSRACEALSASLPPGSAFVLLAASPDGKIAQYAGNVERDTSAALMLETVERWYDGDYVPR